MDQHPIDSGERVCYKDRCKATYTNPIPNGEQWIRAKQDSDTGCCLFFLGACDWCVPPASGSNGGTISGKSSALFSHIIEQAQNKIIILMKFSYEGSYFKIRSSRIRT